MIDPSEIGRAVGLLDRWFDQMRGQGGYGGPVAHWWRDSLIYCGTGLDWRYEGIVDGYLTLFDRTGRPEFLEKARRAGDDLVQGQLRDGTFSASSFERNPRPGGTPHEAAADIALLLLARALRVRKAAGWEAYLDAARRNAEGVLIGRLWNRHLRRFCDPGGLFVPNKAATTIEALCLLVELTGSDEILSRYVGPTTDAILEHQVAAPGDPLDGAVAQAGSVDRQGDRFMPYYVARTIPGLCAAYQSLGEERYIEAARRAGRFVLRWRDSDGGSPQIVYRGRRANRYPRWIAGAGDVVRAIDVLAAHGFTADPGPTLRWILDGQLPSGSIRVAEGFASQVSQRQPHGPPDLRDVLPVAGWNDKAFRALAARVVNVDAPSIPAPVTLSCSWRRRSAAYREDGEMIEALQGGVSVYRWRKGEPWAWMA